MGLTTEYEIIYNEDGPSEGLKILQKAQLKLLDEFNKFCTKRKIKYFLTAGTALGAIRHEGIIPWDDDIDVGMIREDYELFLREWRNTNEIEVDNFKNDCNVPFIFTKLRIKNTHHIEMSNESISDKKGIYIDIFPYDNIESNKILFNLKLIAIKILVGIITSYSIEIVNSSRNMLIKTIRLFLYKNRKLLPLCGIHEIIETITRKVYGKKNDHCMSYQVYGPGEVHRTKFLNSSLTKTHNVKFENRYYPVVDNVKQFLKTSFGDYEELPSMIDRNPRHSIRIKINTTEIFE